MNRISILLGLTMTICFLSSVKATTEFGFVGQSCWSNNFYLDNPKGWGLYASKSLSQKVSVRFTYSRLDKEIRYIGIMQFGFPPIDATAPRELIRSDVSVNLYEVTFHRALVEGNKVRLEAGAGLGMADFGLHLLGTSTGDRMTNDRSSALFTLSADLIVKTFIVSPMVMRLGYQYRTMSTPSQILDGFEPFTYVSMSSVNVAIVSRL